MKYHVFEANEQGFEPLGNVHHVNALEEWPDDNKARIAISRWEHRLGVKLTAFRYTNIYDNRTYRRIYGEGKLIGT